MKRLLLIIALVITSIATYAVPAKPGVWKTITTENGKEIRVQLCGDERMHFWQAADGTRYRLDADTESYKEIAQKEMMRKPDIRKLRGFSKQTSIRKAPKKSGIYSGIKRGLVILVQYQNLVFNEEHNPTLYNRILNEEGFTSPLGFEGSVRDYFKAQSGGQLDLQFDVIGPVTLKNNYQYYGKNDIYGDDQRAGEMVAEACLAVSDEVDFSKYDWDGDGEVEQVYVLYAGYGEASYDDPYTIWPHEWDLESSDYQSKLHINGITINTYACGCELNGEGNIDGIGTFCHEFSHCMGLPDTYDTAYSGNYGMGHWDIMCSGTYNGNSFKPAGYTSYEKMTAGWITPIELNEKNKNISGMKALSEGGEAYIIYNGNNRNEYYLLENRQQTGWDTHVPGEGLLILHVDYDEAIWNYNMVNTIDDYSEYEGYGADASNDHQRLTIFHADNDDDINYWRRASASYWKTTEDTDPYPYENNDSLTSNSVPKASLYNRNIDGSYLMGKSIKDIRNNSDGTVSFKFEATKDGSDDDDDDRIVLLHETFDMCDGSGGNDGKWSGNVGSETRFKPDLTGWQYNKAIGCDKCVRFGLSDVNGNATTPQFQLNGKAILTFRAAPFGSDNNTVDVYVNNELLNVYTLEREQWNEFKAEISSEGTTTIMFIPGKRFFLDDICVYIPASSGIKDITTDTPYKNNNRIYSLDGRYLGTDINILGKGIYIIQGKKVIK